MIATGDAIPATESALDAVDAARTTQLPFSFAKRHGLLVREHDGQPSVLLCRDGASLASIAEAQRFLGAALDMERVNEAQFDMELQQAYERGSGPAMQMMDGFEEETDLLLLAQELPEQSDLLESDDEAPIIRLINALLTESIKENASDIHIEPYENRLVVRMRIDGVLREVLQTARGVAPLLVSRIKVMSKLDIAEKRLPQDGRISLRRARRRCARVDDALRSRRARRDATARQAGRASRSRAARHAR